MDFRGGVGLHLFRVHTAFLSSMVIVKDLFTRESNFALG